MLKHSFLELSKLQDIIFILICNLKYFCHGFSQINTMVFSLSNLDEYCHDFIQLIQGNNLVSISIKKVEDGNKIITLNELYEIMQLIQGNNLVSISIKKVE